MDSLDSAGNHQYTIKSKTDYYVYCLSSSWSPRLFGDFEKDSCLIIKNPSIFEERMVRALSRELPDWQGLGTKVTYIDPLNCSKDGIEIFYSKHFKFAYQKEYRIAWYPSEPIEKLKPFFIYLGNMEDICELIKLNDR